MGQQVEQAREARVEVVVAQRDDPAEHRGAVMSAFYIVAYASLSLPAILAGVLVTPLGPRPTFEIFGSVIAALALVVAYLAWRTRPVARPVPSYVMRRVSSARR